MLRPDRVHRDRGAAAVEFAIVAPLLILILLGLVDFGRMFFVQINLAGASREGARAVSVGRPGVQVESVVQASSPGVARISSLGDVTALSVQQQRCPANGSTNAAVVVSVPFRWFMPVELLRVFNPSSDGGQTLTLQSRSEMLCLA